jgi:hypothetical protein
MPYIPQIERPGLNEVVEAMNEWGVSADGDLNYILYAFCVRHVVKSYGSLKNYCGELRQCATEIERRILAPYEDLKIMDNGDIE